MKGSSYSATKVSESQLARDLAKGVDDAVDQGRVDAAVAAFKDRMRAESADIARAIREFDATSSKAARELSLALAAQKDEMQVAYAVVRNPYVCGYVKSDREALRGLSECICRMRLADRAGRVRHVIDGVRGTDGATRAARSLGRHFAPWMRAAAEMDSAASAVCGTESHAMAICAGEDVESAWRRAWYTQF